MTPIPVGPAEYEVMAASLAAVRHAHTRVGVRLPRIGTDDWIWAGVDARVAALTAWGMHYIHIVRPAEQAELRQVADDVHGGDPDGHWRALAARWSGIGHPDAVAAARGPQLPARCDRCHHHLGRGAAA